LFGQKANNKHVGSFIVVFLLVAATMSVSFAQETPKNRSMDQTVSVVGRILADLQTIAFGSGLGPKYTVFIFGAEENGGKSLSPIKVTYAFFKSEGLPPDAFFDYSKRYELQVERDARCDESVKSLAYVKNVDESGKPLPPSYVLRFLEGAPKDALEEDAVLPCYSLRPGKYKILGRDKDKGR
jgi:hypothetical protein